MAAERKRVDSVLVGRRGFIGGSLAAGALATLAACGKKGGDAAAGSAASGAAGGTLNFYINNPIAIDPYNCQEDQGTQVEYQLFDSLTMFDYEQEKLVGLAAESWEASSDATKFTFHLVKGAKFHNGDAVDSKAFKRGWERIVNPKSEIQKVYGPSTISYHLTLVKGYDELMAGNASELTGVTCPDDETLVVELSAPYADFPYVCSHPALAPVPEAAESDAKNFYLAPIGNGPFKMDGKWEDGQQINLVKFDDYYGKDKAKIAGVHFSIQKDMETAYKEFQAGNLDVCDVPVAQIDAAKKDRGESKDGYTMSEGQHMLLGGEPSTYYIMINNTVAPFNDPQFRKAISLAINRQAICDTLYKGTRKPAGSIVPPGIDGYEADAWEDCKYDVDAAKELLDKLYPADASGSRGLNLTLSYNQDGGHKEIMESVIGDLQKVGITVTSDTPEWAALIKQYDAKSYQFGRMGWIADYPILDNFLYPLFYSKSGDNKSGYANEAVDQGIAEARATVDDAARIKKLQEVNRTIGKDMPVIPLMYYSHTTAGSDRIKNLYMDPQKHCDMSTVELSA